MAIKQSHIIIIASLAAVGITLSFIFVWTDLQSQVERLTGEKEVQQRELEEQQRELEREEVIRLQQKRELEEQQRELEREEAIRLQQQKKLEEQQRELERQKRAQIEEMAKTNPLVNGLIDGQFRFYIEPVPEYADALVKTGIDALASALENYEFYTNVKFERVFSPNDAHIHISWIKNYGSHVLGESIFKSVVKVGLGAENCYGDWQPFDSLSVLKIFYHELGHAMGFGHSSNPENIMYFKTETRFETDYDKIIALDEGEYITIPFCSGGKTLYHISSEDKTNGFHVYVLPPETDSKNFIELGVGKYYPDCSTEELMIEFGDECTVPDGAKLVIHNTDDLFNFDVIRVDVKIMDGDLVKLPTDLEWDWSVFEYDKAWLNEIWNMYH